MDLDAQGPTSAGSGPKSADRRGADGPRLVVQIAASDLSDVLTDRGRVLKQRMALPVLVAALGVIPLLILEEWILPDSDSPWLAAANWAIWAVFTVELAVMLAVTPRRRAYLRRYWLDVAIVAVTFPLLPYLLLTLRLLRLVVVVRHLRTALGRVLGVAGLQYVLVVLVALVIGGGVVFSRLEEEHSVADGIWWAVVTATSVGYGDLVPASSQGRVLAMVLMLLGLGFMALLTAAIAARIVDADEDRIRKQVMRRLEEQQAENREIKAQLRELSEALKRQ